MKFKKIILSIFCVICLIFMSGCYPEYDLQFDDLNNECIKMEFVYADPSKGFILIRELSNEEKEEICLKFDNYIFSGDAPHGYYECYALKFICENRTIYLLSHHVYIDYNDFKRVSYSVWQPHFYHEITKGLIKDFILSKVGR